MLCSENDTYVILRIVQGGAQDDRVFGIKGRNEIVRIARKFSNWYHRKLMCFQFSSDWRSRKTWVALKSHWDSRRAINRLEYFRSRFHFLALNCKCSFLIAALDDLLIKKSLRKCLIIGVCYFRSFGSMETVVLQTSEKVKPKVIWFVVFDLRPNGTRKEAAKRNVHRNVRVLIYKLLN